MNAAPRIAKLKSGESTTLFVPTFPNAVFRGVPLPPFKAGDLDIEIAYTTSIFRLRREAVARFSIRELSDGTYQWFHKAVSEPSDD
jgi:hypothetical protein